MKTVAVLQSNYIPWKGYFDIIHDVDEFVFYDDVQFTKNDWRNRNKIKTPKGTKWLTIPVGASLNRLIFEVDLPNKKWASDHYKTLEQFYSKAPFYRKYKDFLGFVYLESEWTTLSELNQYLIKTVSTDFLGITVVFKDSRELQTEGKKLDRLLDLLGKTNADIYISGPNAAAYIDQDKFAQSNIQLVYKDYSGYPEYEQFFPPFDHYVSIFDLLFHTGPDAPYYIWGWRESGQHGKG
ncbi:WbqC family protein [Effusibacillus dendaii]|uniref:WbqC family protein n=1 Tax=Effusibacillus dendaii TaxID=2743772 RepID=A0A7I8DCL1_9BACL|nr:WbqC family protein [Effusibacillus dendaii]BCJ87825.1 hypothetical protein skT53_28100 [Effusibacillus dendaii]